MEIELEKYRETGEVITDSFEIIRKHFSTLLNSLIMIAGIPLAVSSGLIGLLWSDISQVDDTEMSESVFFVLKFIGYILLASVGQVLVICIVLVVLGSHKKHSHFTNEQIWAEVKTILPKMLLLFLAHVALYVVIAIVAILLGIGGITAFLLVLLIPFSLYILVAYSFIYNVCYQERKSVIDCFKRSAFLVKSNWWETFQVLFLMGLVYFIITAVFQIPLYVLTFVTELHKVTQEPSLVHRFATAVFVCLMSFGNSVSTVMLWVALTLQYHNLVERKEHRGLINKISNIGVSLSKS
jgi:hypothetical protein